MGNIKILEETTRNPITLMGQRAGVCWGADITDKEKNYKRGLNCLKSGHGRVMEYVNVELILDGYSARVIREWYTHIGGEPTRLQASTRYIKYEDFKYVLPHTVERDEKAKLIYEETMKAIADAASKLENECGIPREDAAMLLPLGMTTKIVDKRNLRNLIDMSHQRMCSRAFWEYRELMRNLCNALKAYSEEWAYLVDNYFKPKCKVTGVCPETKSCGMMPKYQNLLNRSDFIATTLWTEEDIRKRLIENGYAGSDEEVSMVLNTGLLKNLGDCTDSDWQMIDDAINAAALKSEDDGSREPEDS